MKKRILALLTLIIMISTFAFSCGLFGINSEKDMQRTIATVGDKNVYQDEIKKYELVNYYLSSGSQYLEQGKTVSETMEYLLNQLIYRRIVIQTAVNYLIEDFYKNTKVSNYLTTNGFTYYKITSRSESYNVDNVGTEDEYLNYLAEERHIDIKENLTIKDVLSPADGEPDSSELLMVLLRVYYDSENISNPTSFKDYYKQLKTSNVFSDYLTIGAFNNLWESEKSALDTLENQLKKDYDIEIVEEDEEESAANTRAIPAKDETEKPFVLPAPNKPITEYLRIEAKKKYEKQIAANYYDMTYNAFVEKQLVSELEQKALERYEDLIIERETIKFSDFKERFDAIKDTEKQKFGISLNDYKTQLQGLGEDTFILYNPDAGMYGYVKQILLGVDTELNASLNRDLSRLKSIEMSRATYVSERKKILNQVRVKDLREGLNRTDKLRDEERFPGNYPDFSDIDYSIEDFYNKFKSAPGSAGNGFGALLIKDTGALVDSGSIYKSTLSNEELLKKFKQWIFMYNTDPGMFNNAADYLLTEKGSMGSGETYVSEFAKTSRDLIQKAYDNYNQNGTEEIGYYALVGTDYGYHLILCTDFIVANREEQLSEAAFNDIVQKINNKTIKAEDKATAIYKLYKIMKNDSGSESYNFNLQDSINKYYKEKKVTFFESRYKDLLKD